MLINILSIFFAFSFIYYGLVCLFSERMVKEFERFGLSPTQRIITGTLQLLGSIGLLIGLLFPTVASIAAIGLSVLMLLGWITRLKIRDGFLQSSPAFIYMVLNAYLAILYIQLISDLN